MSAGAAPFARADAYAPPRRSRAAFALTIGLHLLAAWYWLQQRPAHPPRQADTPGVVTILLHPDAAAGAFATPPARAQRPRTAPDTGQAADRMPALRPHDLPPLHVPLPDVPSAPPSDARPSATSVPATSAPPKASASDLPATPQPAPGESAATAPSSADAGYLAGLGRRQAGRIDRDLRGGKAGVPTEADTPWARFERGLEAAHVDRSMSAHLDSYTAPDGVVIYRRRVGGRIACYRTGSVAGGVDPSIGALGTRGANDAGSIPCPSSAQWKQEE